MKTSMNISSLLKKAAIPVLLVASIIFYFERKSEFVSNLEQSKVSKVGTANVEDVAQKEDITKLANVYKNFRSVEGVYEDNPTYTSKDIKGVMPILSASIGRPARTAGWWAEKAGRASNERVNEDMKGISALSQSKLTDFERVLNEVVNEDTKAVDRSGKTLNFGSATKKVRRVDYRTVIDAIVAQNEVSWRRYTAQWTLGGKIHGVSVRNFTNESYGGVMRDCKVIYKSLEYEGIRPYAVSTSDNDSESLLWVTKDGSALYMYRYVALGGEVKSCRISYFDEKLSTYLVSINADPEIKEKSMTRSLKNLQLSIFTDY